MRITVRVKPNAKKKQIVLLEDGSYTACVTVPPIEGKANEQLLELLAGYFGKRKRDVAIVRGLTGRIKIVDIS